MQELDNKFFEAYKRLDRLCSDMYGCRNGVSQYIDDLECTSYHDQMVLSSLGQSCKTLKHLRWVRNQIAHDSGQFQICEESDIQDINDFYDDIISGQDPLTELRKYRETKTSVKKPVSRVAHVSTSTVPVGSDSRKTILHTRRRNGRLAAAILIVTAVLAVVVFLLFYYL